MPLRSRSLTSLAALALAGAVFAAPPRGERVVGSRRVKTEVRSVRGFDGVELFGVGDVTLVQGDRETLTIEAEDNILPLIVSRVERGTLRLGIERPNVETHRPIKFRLSVRGLKRLIASGAGQIETRPVSTPTLDVDVSGAGSVKMERLNTESLRVQLSGAGGMRVAGIAQRQQVDISGAGNYQAGRLLTRDTELSLSGAGEARVHASHRFKATVSGAGSVRYSGSPAKTEIKNSGAGSVSRD